MTKIKTLAIAPYNGLKDLINELAKERSELDVHTFVADMLDGVEIVKSIQEEQYDAIISRAGTADLIRGVSELPVIDIKLSIIDMMRAIKLAQNYFGPFVIVGYKSITESADMICQIMEYDVEVKTITDIYEIDGCLAELKNKGISLIVGDVITVNRARMMGFNTILVTSGRESVLSSFDEVIRLEKLLSRNNHETKLIKSVLKNVNVSVLCYNQDGKIIYCNMIENLEDNEKLVKETEELVPILLKEKECRILKRFDDNPILIRGELLDVDGIFYPAFFIEMHKASLKPFTQDIIIKNASDAQQVNLETFNTSNEILKNAIEQVKVYSQTSSPIILYGEKGTGKETLAHAIYHNSQYNKNPFIIINAKHMNYKKWVSLFESEDSLFTNSDFTFYIKNLHFMDEVSQTTFESYFRNTYVHKRNRFIFSCIHGNSKSFDNSSLQYFIKNELNALPIIMPSLSERKEDIPSLASIFLSDLILKYGKQVIGLEKDAIKLLQDFHWNNNIDQLRRVMEELIILTDSYYVNAETVNRVLSSEDLPESNNYRNFLNLDKPLDEINKDIINLVLAEENFNQSKAADRLGISRSTLWRKIK
ncbi:sigma-54-dependent Fis family transcriptional regulator [Bacillus dakarensis]|uniref:sigma-54-dependent Fis family transcriptional regulator n=1 Tax=Robertmurraya dakarensis TaxID=1926278 RepID=UPI000981B766|nr:sigma-54-dependent transcriptional regulator [Bacillus dakarensis]